MSLSLVAACIWVVVACIGAMFPSKRHHWPFAYVLIAIGIPILGIITYQHGPWVGLVIMLAGMSILRWPVVYLWRWVKRQKGHEWVAAMDTDVLPTPRGRLTPERRLADLTWLRVGGPAEWLFQPADVDDLAGFLAALDPGVPVFPMGVGSNLIVRDGGIRGVVIRLGRGFNEIAVEASRVTAGAAALDAHVARKAAEAGLDLTFLRTIPGSIGGAVRMNAGCYGHYVADRLVSAEAVTRSGEVVTLGAADLRFGYRQSALPEGWVLTRATFEAPEGDPAALAAKMDDQLARRDESQPTKDRTAGSTFRNPAGYSSTGAADDTHELKAWSVIDSAGLRGARLGGAVMNEKHPNFLTNSGEATAAELESLGEMVREKVFQTHGIRLEWEIMRVGEPAPD